MNPNTKSVVSKVIILVILIIIGGALYLVAGKKVVAPVGKDVVIPVEQVSTTTSNIKTYSSSKTKISFNYPETLTLKESGNKINLLHTIPFENTDGGCDMKGDGPISQTLNDFNFTFEIVSGESKPPYVDGNYQAGEMKGEFAYMGAEGCGETKFYFPISGNRTLIVTKEEIAIFSQVVSKEVRDKVLAVPGAISREKAMEMFNQILSSIKITP